MFSLSVGAERNDWLLSQNSTLIPLSNRCFKDLETAPQHKKVRFCLFLKEIALSYSFSDREITPYVCCLCIVWPEKYQLCSWTMLALLNINEIEPVTFTAKHILVILYVLTYRSYICLSLLYKPRFISLLWKWGFVVFKEMYEKTLNKCHFVGFLVGCHESVIICGMKHTNKGLMFAIYLLKC